MQFLGSRDQNCKGETSTQFRKSQLVEQGITRTRREVHAEDSHKDNSLSEKAAKKSYEAGNCELHKTKFKQLIANAFMKFQRIRRRGVHSQGKRRGVVQTLSHNW